MRDDDTALEHAAGLDLEAHRDFERRWWRLQLVATALFGLLVVGAVLGIFGSGLFTRATRQDGGVTVRYERVARVRAPSMMEVELSSLGMRPEQTRITLSPEISRMIAIERVVPEPRAMATTAEGIEYLFPTDATRAPMSVRFYLKPAGSGILRGRILVEGSRPMAIPQLVLP